MSGFLTNLKEQYDTLIERHHNLPFLKATMAACALVATADGEVSFSERAHCFSMILKVTRLR